MSAYGPWGPASEEEAHHMLEASVRIHRSLCDRARSVPWWRFGVRSGLRSAIQISDAAARRWADEADRLSVEVSS